MDWKKAGKKILFPPLWLMAILTVLSTVLLVLIFTKGWEQTPLAYGSYVLAFYTLSVVVLFFVRVFPGSYKTLRSKAYDNPLSRRYLTDRDFRFNIVFIQYIILSLIFACHFCGKRKPCV